MIDTMNNEYEAAVIADKNDVLTPWVIDFLNNAGQNAQLADTLLNKGQFHTKLIQYPISKLISILGPDPSFMYFEEPTKFNHRAKAMVESLEQGWKPVPLIATDLWNGRLTLADGAHRHEALKRYGIETYPTIFYFRDQLALDSFLKSLSES